MGRRGTTALVAAGVAVGLIAENQRDAWSDVRGWAPDLVAGWALIGLAVIQLARSGRSRQAGLLLLAAGFLWFAFNFASAGPEATRWAAERSAFLHRAPLFALALALPSGFPRSRLARAGVALSWASAVIWPVWDNDISAILLAALLVGIALVVRTSARGDYERRSASRGLAAVVLLAAAITLDAARSALGSGQVIVDAVAFSYPAAVTLSGALLFASVALAAPAQLAERAVAMAGTGTTLRDALRHLLGDGDVAIGFDLGGPEPLDELGRPLAPPAADLVTTPVTANGARLAVVHHGVSTLDDEVTRSAVVAAVALTAERAIWRSAVARQIDALEASSRRLTAAEDEERRRLADRVERGPVSTLAAVEELLTSIAPDSDGGELDEALARASVKLAELRPELDGLIGGLGGTSPADLRAALARLAADRPLRAELLLEPVDVAPAVASALWFVCSESLANTAKHAAASVMRITLATVGDRARLTVEDDGCGGADPRGSGLSGLADRVAMLGGTFRLESPAGAGTRVVAELPSRDDP